MGKEKEIVLEDCYDVLYNHTKKALGMLDASADSKRWQSIFLLPYLMAKDKAK